MLHILGNLSVRIKKDVPQKYKPKNIDVSYWYEVVAEKTEIQKRKIEKDKFKDMNVIFFGILIDRKLTFVISDNVEVIVTGSRDFEKYYLNLVDKIKSMDEEITVLCKKQKVKRSKKDDKNNDGE
jgi:hypothetical protein